MSERQSPGTRLGGRHGYSYCSWPPAVRSSAVSSSDPIFVMGREGHTVVTIIMPLASGVFVRVMSGSGWYNLFQELRAFLKVS